MDIAIEAIIDVVVGSILIGKFHTTRDEVYSIMITQI